MPTGTNLTYTKAYNYRIVFETIRLHSPIARSKIAEKTSLTAQTVSNIVARMLKAGLIEEGEKVQEGRGAPSISLKINAKGAYSIGLDFDRDHLTGVLVDLNGTVLQKLFYDVDYPSPDETIEKMVDIYQKLIQESALERSKPIGVGVSFPGPMDLQGNNFVSGMISPSGFQNWNRVPVVDRLKKHIDIPVYLENNASAAAIGEHWYGIGRHIPSFMYIFFGAGLGSGLIFDGELYKGHYQNAGEIGYYPLSKRSPLSVDKQPHVGEHFNLTELYKWLNEDGLSISTPDDLEILFKRENTKIKQWINDGVSILLPLFLAIEYILDPETIVFGGRLPSPLITSFSDRIEEQLPKARISGKKTGPSFRCATGGTDTAVLGAATLPMYDLFAPQSSVLIKKE